MFAAHIEKKSNVEIYKYILHRDSVAILNKKQDPYEANCTNHVCKRFLFILNKVIIFYGDELFVDIVFC